LVLAIRCRDDQLRRTPAEPIATNRARLWINMSEWFYRQVENGSKVKLMFGGGVIGNEFRKLRVAQSAAQGADKRVDILLTSLEC
jgi:hypothetical protein